MTATERGNEAIGAGRRRVAPGLVCLALCLAALAAVPGCRGCRKDPAELKKEREKKEAEERAKKKEKPKPDFEIQRLAARPGSRLPPGPTEPLGAAYKPGHWTAATLEAKANNFDFVGDLQIAVAGGNGRPVSIQAVPFDLTTSCQIALGKGQRPKAFESFFVVPPTDQLPNGRCRLNWRKGGNLAWESQDLLSPMPSYQYHLVVIAAFPENYTYLKGLPSVKPPTDELSDIPTKPYYRVALIGAEKPDPQRRLLLPSYGLLWTSIACVLWDEAEPDALDPPQQEAMLDWLHWGGQLVISGPGSLDKLTGSFLDPYLPATAAPGARQLSAEDFADLDRWSTASGQSGRTLVPPKNWTGIQLQRHPQAQFMPGSGDLLAERRVGRGRIVVSAFPLSSRALRSWPAADEMFNAFLLRRPPRRFSEDPYAARTVTWADGHRQLDAGCICGLRYFSRDLCALSPGKTVGFGTYLSPGVTADPNPGDPYQLALRGGLYPSRESLSQGPGVAAWNDFNPVANSARTTLVKAAQIEIPGRSFVVWVLAAYLLVLVPANWSIFRLINRVEWAWAVAPLIAVGCAVAVIRMAQLDIGFARSRTEIAVVELQGDYPRAHVTRYTALYTSLMTGYEIGSADPGLLVLPFPEVENPASYEPRARRTLLFRRGVDVSLTGYYVPSNATGMIHSEQMLDLGGGLCLLEAPGGRLQLANNTQLTLLDVGVLRKDDSGSLWAASLDRPLTPGTTVPLSFNWRSETPDDNPLRERQQGGRLLGSSDPKGLSLLEAAQDASQLQRGDVRLVARLEDQVPGLEVRPAAPQSRFATLVVAHLRHGFDKDPQPDANYIQAGADGQSPTDTGDEETSGQEW